MYYWAHHPDSRQDRNLPIFAYKTLKVDKRYFWGFHFNGVQFKSSSQRLCNNRNTAKSIDIFFGCIGGLFYIE